MDFFVHGCTVQILLLTPMSRNVEAAPNPRITTIDPLNTQYKLQIRLPCGGPPPIARRPLPLVGKSDGWAFLMYVTLKRRTPPDLTGVVMPWSRPALTTTYSRYSRPLTACAASCRRPGSAARPLRRPRQHFQRRT
jgi:hypothetical protein